jgi:transcription elongation factor Elf1
MKDLYFKFPCPECNHEIDYSVEKLKSLIKIQCPNCKKTINPELSKIDRQKLNGFQGRIEKLLKKGAVFSK